MDSQGGCLLALQQQLDDANFLFHGSPLWYESRPHSMYQLDDMPSSFYPIAFTSLPSGLSLSEVDIDRSIHKLFEGLPEILPEQQLPSPADNGKNTIMLPAPATSLPQVAVPLGWSYGDPRSVAVPSSKSVPEDAPADNGEPHYRQRVARDGIRVQSPSSNITKLETGPKDEVDTLNRSKRKSEKPHETELQPPKKARNPGSECSKKSRWTHPSEQAEHILRERQRRDDMTTKFSLLESLLPSSSKRDRSTIVEDAMKYVKNLQHRKEALCKKRSDMKLAVATGPPSKSVSGVEKDMKHVHMSTIRHCSMAETGSPNSTSETELPLATEVDFVKTRPGSLHLFKGGERLSKLGGLKNCVKKLHVYSDLPHEIVIEMICQAHPRFHSAVIEAVESLNLDVIRCTSSKLIQGMICFIVAKPRKVPAHLMQSSDSILGALKSAFEPECSVAAVLENGNGKLDAFTT